MANRLIWLLCVLPLLLARLYADCGFDGTFALNCASAKNEEATLKEIKFGKTLYYQCTYARYDGTNYESELKHYDCTSKFNLQAKSISAKDHIIGAFVNDIFKYRGVKGTSPSVFADAIDTAPIYARIATLKPKIAAAKSQWKSFYRSVMESVKIDSKAKSGSTLSAIYAGLVTVDSKYFVDGYVNSLGEAELKPKYKKVTTLSPESQNALAALWAWLTGDASASRLSFKLSSPIDFLDKYVLSYFIQFAVLIRPIFMEMVLWAMVLLFLYSSTFYVYKKWQSRFLESPESVNALPFMTGTAVAVAFFVVPVISDGTVKQLPHGMHADSKNNGSSLAQEFIRVSAQTSTYFANWASDVAMKVFLSHSAKKMGFLDVDDTTIADLKKRAKEIDDDKTDLLQEGYF